ncbi:MAG: nucleotidyltransferase family protein [Pseudoflavonifractor sp.]
MGLNIGLVFMASGAGRRFGSNKLLTDLGGATLAARTLAAYPPALFSIAAVVSCHPEILALAAAQGYRGLHNPAAEEGISASIRTGMALMADMDGVLFAVADQPNLTGASVARVIAEFEAHPRCISALSWQGERGNPCLFPRSLFPALSALRGDNGGGKVIRAHPELLHLVAAETPRELHDIDAPEDLI